MNTHRMNITLPLDLAKMLEGKPNKSAFIAEALRSKISEDEERLKKIELASAYEAGSREVEEIVEDWDPLAGEGL